MPSLDLNDLPLRARWLILVVVGIGVTTVAVAIPDVAMWNRADLLACVALAAGIVGTEQFPIRLRYRTESINFSLTEALWVIGLLQARPSVLTVSVAAGLLTSQLVRRRRAFKIGFNVGQFLVGEAQPRRGSQGLGDRAAGVRSARAAHRARHELVQRKLPRHRIARRFV